MVFMAGVPAPYKTFEAQQEKLAKIMRQRKRAMEYATKSYSAFLGLFKQELQRYGEVKKARAKTKFIKRRRKKQVLPQLGLPPFEVYLGQAYREAYEKGKGKLPRQRGMPVRVKTLARDIYEKSTSRFRKKIEQEYTQAIKSMPKDSFLITKPKEKGRFG